MTTQKFDILIIGAGPVGLMCAYLAQLCGLSTMIVDKSEASLQVGKADALNARTLQLFEIVKIFDELYPLGKTCRTSSIWSNGKFLSRQSSWWDNLSGCMHKHFLMLGQAYVEQNLDKKLLEMKAPVRRLTEVVNVDLEKDECVTTLYSSPLGIGNNQVIKSNYIIAADGAHSYVRKKFNIPFEITKPRIIWAVIDGVIETDFKKVPEIIVFQTTTSDVAWIPREGDIDRFYVRMDKATFTFEEAIGKINKALHPYTLKFKNIVWHSKFSVKESVAEKFSINERIFLAGDACHIHSVNGGQGLNTGLGDAFNLIWKINMVKNYGASNTLLKTYEEERKPVALSVVQTSGELVRSTKYSKTGTHAQDYVKIIEKKSGNITGMGICYGQNKVCGTRLFDFEIFYNTQKTRIYSLLDYTKFTLLIFSEHKFVISTIPDVSIVQIFPKKCKNEYWSNNFYYKDKILLVRPDSYIDGFRDLT